MVVLVGPPTSAQANSMASGAAALDPGKRITSLASPTAPEHPGSSGDGLVAPLTVDPLTGAATTFIPIEVPPGRRLTPSLGLSYSSNASNGPYGLGWSLSIGVIRRDLSSGISLDASGGYAAANGFVLDLDGHSVLLDNCLGCGPTEHTWLSSTADEWLLTSFDPVANLWRVDRADGTRLWFGGHVTARSGRNVDAANQTFAWALTRIEDAVGNVVDVSYLDVRVPGESGHPHSYVQRVSYGGHSDPSVGYSHKFHVEFDYETRPDILRSYREGFRRTIDRRLQRIRVIVDGSPVNPIREYQLGYTALDGSGLSLLSSVTLLPLPGSGTAGPPPTTFEYHQPAKAFSVRSGATFGMSRYTPGIGDLMDLDGDGFLDFLIVDYSLRGVQFIKGRGNRFNEWAFWPQPLEEWEVAPELGPHTFGWYDLNADGLPDAVDCLTLSADLNYDNLPVRWVWWNTGDGFVTEAIPLKDEPEFVANDPSATLCIGESWSGPGGMWHHVGLVDINGDGIPDMLEAQTQQASGYVTARLGLGNGRFAPGVPWRSPIWVGEADGVQARGLADLNGDGLPDMVDTTTPNNLWHVYFNNGAGFEADPFLWPGPSPQWPGATPFGLEALLEAGRIALRDMNGDGLVDYVNGVDVSSNFTAPWKVYLNTGSGFDMDHPSTWQGQPAAQWIRDVDFWVNGHPVTSDLRDLNGDGIEDYVLSQNSWGQVTAGDYDVYWGEGTKPGLIRSITNGLGATTTVDYGLGHASIQGEACVPRGNLCGPEGWPVSRTPHQPWVVSKVRLSDGRSPERITKWAFAGAYFDTSRRELRGFRQSTETIMGNFGGSSVRVIHRKFAAPPYQATAVSPMWPQAPVPSRPFKLVEERTTGILAGSGNQTLTKTAIDWEISGDGFGRTFSRPVKRVEIHYGAVSNGSAQSVTKQWTYNALNLQTAETVHGDPADGVPPITTNVKYLIDTCAGWSCLGLPHVRCPGSPAELAVAQGGTTLSLREFVYDTKCRLTDIRERLAAAGQSAQGGTPVTTIKVLYDEGTGSPDAKAAKAGQPTEVRDALGVAASPPYGTRLAYGCSHGVFACSIKNPFNQDLTRTYDLRWGKETQVIDANGQTTTYAYDGLGRLTSVTRPLSNTPWRKWRYHFGSPGSPPTPSRIETQVYEPNESTDADGNGSPLYLSSMAFFDSFGRPLQTRSLQYVGDLNTARTAKTVVRDAVEYDAVGRVLKRYAAFVSDVPPHAYSTPPAGTGFSTATYDVLDRVTRTTNADGTYRNVDYLTAGQVITYDENYHSTSSHGSKQMQTSDALGLRPVVKTYAQSANGEVLWTTTTTWKDGLGRETSTLVHDHYSAKQATTEIEYDSFGRRTRSVDSNSGVWTYAYDLNGNLIFQNDPKAGQHVAMCYDRLNRATRKLYPNGDTLPANYGTLCTQSASTLTIANIAYVYDDSTTEGCSQLTQGRLCSVTERLKGPSGDLSNQLRKRFTYDARGRVTAEFRRLSLAIAGVGTTREHTTRVSYDLADRLALLHYPTVNANGSDELIYAYNDLGQLDAAYFPSQNFANQLAYDAFGRITVWTDGSGLRHAMSFSPDPAQRYRLQETRVEAVSDGTLLQRLHSYAYDATGNIRSFADGVGSGVLSNGWTYTYDGLSRLGSATRSGAGASNYAYDGIGNLLANGNIGFNHSSSQPNQIQSSPAIPGTYGYDANGALAQRPDLDGSGADAARSITYDAEGRVSEVALANGRTVRSVYDYGGARVARIVDEGSASQQVSFYFGRAVEVTGGTLVRHVYLGGKLIAESPVPAPVNLMLASAAAKEHVVQLARVLGELARDPHALFAGFVMSREQAAKSTAFIVLLLLILGATPGRVAVAFVSGRHSALKRLRRGHVLVVVVVFATTLTPLTCARVADAGTPNGNNPYYPVYFVSSDHLGSTLMLTCFKQGSACDDRAVARHYRYDAFGKPSAYDGNGAPTDLGTPLVYGFVAEKLYTGQRWDDAAQTYDYGARMYDPRLARFLTHDPVREYMNPYAYVRWNPVRLTDPTGMFGVAGGALFGAGFNAALAEEAHWNSSIALKAFAALIRFRAAGSGGMTGGNAGGSPWASGAAGMTTADSPDAAAGTSKESGFDVLYGRGDVTSSPNDGPVLHGGTYPEVVVTATPLGTLAQAVLVGLAFAVLVAGGITVGVSYLASRPGALAMGALGAAIGGVVAAIRGGSLVEGAIAGFVQGAVLGGMPAQATMLPIQALTAGVMAGSATALSQYMNTGAVNGGAVVYDGGMAAVGAIFGGAAGAAAGNLAGVVLSSAHDVGSGVLARMGAID